MMENKEFYLRDDGINIHVKLDLPDVSAAGAEDRLPLLILIHGFTGNMEENHLLAVKQAALESGFAVLRAEMYGHGMSGGAFRDHTLHKWISNAMTVIDYARGLDFVSGLYLAGHSQGGLLTILIGAMEKDRLKAILPLSPALKIPVDARSGNVLGMPFDPDRIPEQVEDGEGLVLGGNYIRIAQMIDAEAAIRRYKGPVLIVHGSADETIPVQYSIDAAGQYADARLVVIPDDTHCYDLHPDMLADAVRDFLQTLHHPGSSSRQMCPISEPT